MGHDLSPSSADDKTYNTAWLDRSGRDHSLSRFSANRMYRSGVVCNRSMRQTTRSENTLVCGYCAVGALCTCVCRTDRTGAAAEGDGAQGHHRRCRKCLGPAPVEPTNNNGQKRALTRFGQTGSCLRKK